MKTQRILERLEMVERRLANAEEYLTKNINVEGSAFLHHDDWRGKSGHPSWVRNFMIPTMLTYRARKERALENMLNKVKEKNISKRKRR